MEIFSWVQTSKDVPGKAHLFSWRYVAKALCWEWSLARAGLMGELSHILGAILAVFTCAVILKQYFACMQWTSGLRGSGFVCAYTHYTYFTDTLEISAAENAASVGKVCCMCSHGTEEGPREIEPFGKVCGLDLIFLLGHSCLGLWLLLAQITALVCWKQRLQSW